MVKRMKYGRLLAVAGVFVFCLLGCSVRRSGSTTDSRRTEEQKELVYLGTLSDAKVSTTTTVTDRWRNLRIVRRDYDLDKPRNEKGEYPVKSETVIEGDEQQKEDKKEDKAEKSDKKESAKGASRHTDARDSGSASDTTGQVGLGSLWWWLVGAVSVVVTGFLIWWKYGKKDQTK